MGSLSGSTRRFQAGSLTQSSRGAPQVCLARVGSQMNRDSCLVYLTHMSAETHMRTVSFALLKQLNWLRQTRHLI